MACVIIGSVAVTWIQACCCMPCPNQPPTMIYPNLSINEWLGNVAQAINLLDHIRPYESDGNTWFLHTGRNDMKIQLASSFGAWARRIKNASEEKDKLRLLYNLSPFCSYYKLDFVSLGWLCNLLYSPILISEFLLLSSPVYFLLLWM